MEDNKLEADIEGVVDRVGGDDADRDIIVQLDGGAEEQLWQCWQQGGYGQDQQQWPHLLESGQPGGGALDMDEAQEDRDQVVGGT